MKRRGNQLKVWYVTVPKVDGPEQAAERLAILRGLEAKNSRQLLGVGQEKMSPNVQDVTIQLNLVAEKPKTLLKSKLKIFLGKGRYGLGDGRSERSVVSSKNYDVINVETDVS